MDQDQDWTDLDLDLDPALDPECRFGKPEIAKPQPR